MRKRENRGKKIIWVGFIILIMVMSALGFLYRGDSDSEIHRYRDYEFIKAESGWIVYLGQRGYKFDYLPTEVENISFDIFSINSSKIYIAYLPNEKDLNMDYSISKLASVFRSLGGIPVLACMEEEGCPDIPLVDCNNNVPVIYFKKENETKVYIDGNCIVLEGDNTGLSRSVDRLNYAFLGVIK